MVILSLNDFCTNSSALRVILFLKELLKIIFILVPIILIVMISIDIAKNVIAGNVDDMQKNLKTTLKRLLMAIIMFLVPTIVNIVTNVFVENGVVYSPCLTNSTKERIVAFDAEEKRERIKAEAERKIKIIDDVESSSPNYITIDNKDKQTEEEEKDKQTDDDKNNELNNRDSNYDKNIKVHFINVLDSDCILIESNNKYSMIDTSERTDGYVSRAVKYLKSNNVKTLDFVLITHGHVDHISGYKTINNNFTIKKLYIKKAGANTSSSYYGDAYRNVINIANNSNTQIIDVNSSGPESINWEGITFKLYNREYVDYTKKSDITENVDRTETANSIVMVANMNGKKVYFAGDIGSYFLPKYTQDLDVAKQIGKIDVYKAAHHGHTSYNNSVKVLEILNPSYSIISNNDPEYYSGFISRIKKLSAYKQHYVTKNGDIIMTISKSGEIFFEQK